MHADMRVWQHVHAELVHPLAWRALHPAHRQLDNHRLLYVKHNHRLLSGWHVFWAPVLLLLLPAVGPVSDQIRD